jgi:hypothetical protein
MADDQTGVNRREFVKLAAGGAVARGRRAVER